MEVKSIIDFVLIIRSMWEYIYELKTVRELGWGISAHSVL